MDSIIRRLRFINGYLMALSSQLEDHGSKETAFDIDGLRVDLANAIYELDKINGKSDETV